MYYKGQGGRQDYAVAKYWHEKAAVQRHVGVQFMLGVMCEKSQGARKNIVAAKEWFGKACDNGSQVGCDEYARLNR